MTNIKLLETLTTILNKANYNDVSFYQDLEKLIDSVKEDYTKEEAKKNGTGNLLKYAKAIIKNIPSFRQDALSGECKINDNYIILDSYRILASKHSLSLHNLNPENYPGKLVSEYLKEFDNLENLQDVNLPEVSQLKMYITEEKAKQKAAGTKAPFIPYKNIIIDNITINASFLLDALQAGFNKCYYKNRTFFFTDNTENKSIILGVYAK